jgi:hypothetical protein
MSDDHLPAVPTMTRQAAAIPGRSARNKVTGKLKNRARSHGLGKPQAERGGRTGRPRRRLAALRLLQATRHGHAEVAALRNDVRAHNVHRLDTIADTSKNDMARVASIKALEQIADQADERRGSAMPTMPGLQIVIAESISGTAFGSRRAPKPEDGSRHHVCERIETTLYRLRHSQCPPVR